MVSIGGGPPTEQFSYSFGLRGTNHKHSEMYQPSLDSQFGYQNVFDQGKPGKVSQMPKRPAPAKLLRSTLNVHNVSDDKTICLPGAQNLPFACHQFPARRTLSQRSFSETNEEYEVKGSVGRRARDSTTTILASYKSPYGSDDSQVASPNWCSQEHLSTSESRQRRQKRFDVGRFCRAVKTKVFNHVDPKVLLEMVDIRHMFWPFGIWKYTVLLCVAVAIVGIVVSEHYSHWIDKAIVRFAFSQISSFNYSMH
jgi:hypothetical protein